MSFDLVNWLVPADSGHGSIIVITRCDAVHGSNTREKSAWGVFRNYSAALNVKYFTRFVRKSTAHQGSSAFPGGGFSQEAVRAFDRRYFVHVSFEPDEKP
jgi:hypothetical protein